MSFRARGCRGEPGWRTRVSFISKLTGVTGLAWQCFDLPAHELNVMGNEHTAKARELRLVAGTEGTPDADSETRRS
jgi:hypothetical protein